MKSIYVMVIQGHFIIKLTWTIDLFHAIVFDAFDIPRFDQVVGQAVQGIWKNGDFNTMGSRDPV